MVHRKIRAGHGQGAGEEYQPWLRIQDVPSHGVVGRIRSRTSGRVIHCMSVLEQQVALCLDFSREVMDLREQFPLLPLEATLEIARKQEVKHPRCPASKVEIIMTSDFLVTVSRNDTVHEVAFAVKPSKDLLHPRVREKLGIEQQYWQEQGIEWRILTEDNLGNQFVRNLRWLHPFAELSSLYPYDGHVVKDVAVNLTRLVREQPGQRLADLCEQYDASLTSGVRSLAVARYLLANQLWVTDLSSFDFRSPLHLLSVHSELEPIT